MPGKIEKVYYEPIFVDMISKLIHSIEKEYAYATSMEIRNVIKDKQDYVDFKFEGERHKL